MTEHELLEMNLLFQKRTLICAQLIAIKRHLYPSLDESSIAQLVGTHTCRSQLFRICICIQYCINYSYLLHSILTTKYSNNILFIM